MVAASRSDGSSGHALVLALVVLLLTATSMMLLSKSLLVRWQRVWSEADRIELVALADGAMAQSLAALAERETFTGAPARPLGRGTIESRVQPVPAFERSSPTAREVIVEVTSRIGGRSFHQRAVVALTEQGPRVLSWQQGR